MLCKWLGIITFFGILIVSGGNLVGAVAGGVIVWLFNVYLWTPVKPTTYDEYGRFDRNGKYYN